MVHARHEPHDIVAEYFEREAATDAKHELVDGVIYAMAGAEPRHSELCGQFEAALRRALEGRGCYVASRDQRVAVDVRAPRPGRPRRRGTYVYPDGVVACPPEFNRDRPRSLVNPKLIIEVLSLDDSRDRAGKLDAYREIEGLDDVVFARIDALIVEHHRRTGPDQWLVTVLRSGALPLEALDITLDLDALYAGVWALPLDDEDDDEADDGEASSGADETV